MLQVKKWDTFWRRLRLKFGSVTLRSSMSFCKRINFRSRTWLISFQSPLIADRILVALILLFIHISDGRLKASSIDFTSSEEDSPVWHKLEEIIVVSMNGSLPYDFKPSLGCYTNWTDNTNHPVCVLDGK